MGQSLDPTYPLFPTFAFLGFLLSLLPLPWHTHAWNSGTCAFMIWTASSCLVGFVNSIVWSGNIGNPAPVWCDISSKIIVGVSTGIPSSILCISRRLYYLTSGQVNTITYEDKRRMVLVDVCISAGIPVVVMVLHYVVQGHRFDILEDVGCYPVIYNTLPAYFIYFMWPVLLGVISFCYSAMTLRSFWIRRVQFSQLISSNTSMTVSRYLRLIMLATIDIMCTIPLGVYSIYRGTVGVKLAPWISWDDTHYNFSYVGLIPAQIWQNNRNYRTAVELARWLPILCALLFFILFGFASEARKSYQTAFSAVLKVFGVRPKKPVLKGLVTWNKSSKASIVSTKTSISVLPVYTVEQLDYSNPVEKTSKSHNCSYSVSSATLTHASTDTELPSLPKQEKSIACNCQYHLPPPLYSTFTTNRQKYDLESHGWERSKSLENDTDVQSVSIRHCTCTDTGASSPRSPTSSSHRTLIGQVIDINRNATADEQRPKLTPALPEIDESDAFTISSFSYYEDSVSPDTFIQTASSVAPSTPPHPPSPRFLPPQRSLPPPPTRKQPRAVGSLSSLLSNDHAETSRFSRESFSFHNSRHPHRRSNPFVRSPLQRETCRPISYPVSPSESLTLDVPEDVGPCSYTQPLGVLDGLLEREEFASDHLPLTRKKVLGIEGGTIQVAVERSASVDDERMH